ncbi:MAG: GNAT family N-acetyltransferase [Synergistaceae bacterium]|nr:GNAT family N-acetyltransferase [Synergistaceae bacterium]
MERDEAMSASAVAENFSATLRLWGALPTSRAEARGPCLFVSTGTAIPDQNYAYCPVEEDAEENVRSSARFFREERMPFTWWFPPGTRGERFRKALEEQRMPERCAPPAMLMALDAPAERAQLSAERTVCKAVSSAEAEEWACSSLEGFDSGPEHQGPFSAFCTSLLVPPFDEAFRLLTLRVGGRAAATALLSLTGEVAGIYYFSTLPAFRRRGLGRLLLSEALEEARRSGCRTAVLQASPMGFALYKKAGFAVCGRFAVHSADPDAC